MLDPILPVEIRMTAFNCIGRLELKKSKTCGNIRAGNLKKMGKTGVRSQVFL